MRPLDGVRVLDLTRALAGPFCTLMLGDYGADVIKIEMPGSGDDTRRWGPPFIGEEKESAYFLSINRNKRSLTLNLREPQAKEIFFKLARDADVVVENFTPGVMARFGLEYEAVKEVNPGVIYCSISGFGQDGPYHSRPAFDQIMQGIGGIMSLTGEPDGAPQKMGVALTDIGAGMWAAFAIVTALFHQRQDMDHRAPGQYIDISMLDAQVAWLTYQAANYFATGLPPKREGAAHPILVPYQAFTCQDGKRINVAVGNERIWERFCRAIDRNDLRDRAEFALNSDRAKNRAALVHLLQEHFKTRPLNQWLEELQRVDVPCGPVNDLADVFSDPQVLHRQMLQEMAHPTLGYIKQTGVPIKFSLTPGGLDRPPPLLGEHNREILRELGYSDTAILEMAEASVI